MPGIIDSVVSHFITPVQKSAGKFKGYCTWPFSQCLDPVRGIMGVDSVSKDGICAMLAAKWIDEHAHGGALANWMTLPGSDNLDPNKIRLMTQLFIVATQMRSGALVGAASQGLTNQTEAIRGWLQTRGLKQRQYNLAVTRGTGARAVKFRGGAKELNFNENTTQVAQGIATTLADKRLRNSYVTISFRGTAAMGHAVAAWIGTDATFFDPNYGEFWFEKLSDFLKWFPHFYHEARYDRWPINFNSSYSVSSYALKV